MNEINIVGLKSMKQKCHKHSNRDVPSPYLVLLLKAPFEGTLQEKYSYIGLIEHLIEVETNNKVKTRIQLPGVLIHKQISHPTITKESCYNIRNSNWITFGIKSTLTQIFDTDFLNCNTLTDFSSHYHKGELLEYRNSNWMTLGINLHWHKYLAL